MTVSPLELPMRAFAMGLETEILPPLRSAQDAGLGDEVLEVGDFELEHPLGLFSGIVFGILRKVALVARLGDSLRDFGTFHRL